MILPAAPVFCYVVVFMLLFLFWFFPCVWIMTAAPCSPVAGLFLLESGVLIPGIFVLVPELVVELLFSPELLPLELPPPEPLPLELPPPEPLPLEFPPPEPLLLSFSNTALTITFSLGITNL